MLSDDSLFQSTISSASNISKPSNTNPHHLSQAEQDAIYRLYNPIKKHHRQDNNETIQSAITELPGETVRWIKLRRKVNNKDLVPITRYRDKQLREMFKGLDFHHKGYLDLKELKDAINYVNEKSAPKLKRSHNVNDLFSGNKLNEIFEAMDVDGDGTIDFKEFTSAMTGNSKSTIDKASEYEIEKMHFRFVEYAELKKRQYAIDSLGKSSNVPTESVKNTKNKVSDFQNYKYFKMLLNIPTNNDEVIVDHSAKIKKVTYSNKLIQNEILLKQLVDQQCNRESRSKRDLEYEKVYQRARQERMQFLERLNKDGDLRALHERIDEELEHIDSRRRNESKWSKVYNKAHGTVKHPTCILRKSETTSDSMKIKIAASKEAYDAMRKNQYNRNYCMESSSHESSTLFSNSHMSSSEQTATTGQRTNRTHLTITIE